MTSGPRIALAHDYLSVRGGAERAFIVMANQFPDARLYTSFFQEELYPELHGRHVVASPMNRFRPLGRHYRAALPLLPAIWNRLRLEPDDDAEVVVCSTTGWAHGIGADVPKIAYCNNPARWLYQRADYTSTMPWSAGVLAPLSPWLRRWDRNAAAGCVHYIANSNAVARRVEQVYGREASVLWPPTSFDPTGPKRPIVGVEPGFVLCVSRLLGYKNVGAVVAAAASMPGVRVVVVGDGPLRSELERVRPSNVVLVGPVDDDRLRWAYDNSVGLVSASYEDFGLTPVEAAMFGKPSALLRAGGFLDTCLEGVNGVFFDSPTPSSIADGVRRMLDASWSSEGIVASAERFSGERFAASLRSLVSEYV